MWLRVVEAWLTARLLSSPAFHRLVQNVHRKVHEIRHGADTEEMGNLRTDRDGPDPKRFLEHYLEEIREQFRRGSTSKK